MSNIDDNNGKDEGYRVFSSIGRIWLKYFEPSAPSMCAETRESLKQCVAQSECYKKSNDFKHCMREGISYDCLSLRKRYFGCKRLAVDRTKDFRGDERYK